MSRMVAATMPSAKANTGDLAREAIRIHSERAHHEIDPGSRKATSRSLSINRSEHLGHRH